MSRACVIRVVDVLVAMFVLCSHLERCKTRLSSICPWLRSVTMELSLKCTLCKPCPDKFRDGTNICLLHKKEGCFHFDCGHYIPLRSFSPSCEHSVDDVPDYPAEKLDPWVQVRKKKVNSIYVERIRRIWNSRLADSSFARNSFVGCSIPIKTWICPGFIFYKYLKSSSSCNYLSLNNKFVWLPEKVKKRNKHK